MEDALEGEVVKTPTPSSLALADGLFGGPNYLEPGAVGRNLIYKADEAKSTVRLGMIRTQVEPMAAAPFLRGGDGLGGVLGGGVVFGSSAAISAGGALGTTGGGAFRTGLCDAPCARRPTGRVQSHGV